MLMISHYSGLISVLKNRFQGWGLISTSLVAHKEDPLDQNNGILFSQRLTTCPWETFGQDSSTREFFPDLVESSNWAS